MSYPIVCIRCSQISPLDVLGGIQSGIEYPVSVHVEINLHGMSGRIGVVHGNRHVAVRASQLLFGRQIIHHGAECDVQRDARASENVDR